METAPAQVAHEQGSHYKPIAPPAGASDDGVNDGLVPETDIDLSEVPEDLR
jgi:hypothetical protein